jgi:integrase
LSEATNLLGAVRRCFRWARRTINPETKRCYVDVDPSAEIPKPLKNKRSRERVLSDDEIIAFWRGCGELGWPFGVIFKLLLLTGQRRSEVAGLRWSELDIEGRVWHLPGSRTKNSRPHDVHLSDLAVDIIQSLKAARSARLFPERQARGAGILLFASPTCLPEAEARSGSYEVTFDAE